MGEIVNRPKNTYGALDSTGFVEYARNHREITKAEAVEMIRVWRERFVLDDEWDPLDGCAKALPILEEILDKVCDCADEDGVVHKESWIELRVGKTGTDAKNAITLNNVGRAREACEFALKKRTVPTALDTDDLRDRYDDDEHIDVHRLCDELDRAREQLAKRGKK